MSLARLLPRSAARALLAALALGAFVPFAPARADDAPAAEAASSPLARLRPEEQALVRAKIPGADALPREKQEQIARNVETLRGLEPAQRDMLRRRLQQARDARLGGQQLNNRISGFGLLGERQKGLALQQGLAFRGLGRLAWRDLPAEIRDDPRTRPLAPAFAVAFHRKFWSRAFRSLDAAAALAYEPLPTLPQELRERLARLRAQVKPGDEKALGRLKEAVLQARALEATRDLLPAPGALPDDGGEDRRLFALGERLRDLARPAYDAVLAEFGAAWREKGSEAWAHAVAEMARPPEPPEVQALTPEARRKLDALQVALTLESLNPVLARNPGLVERADALLKGALVDGLGMSTDDFGALPARGDGAAQERRGEALREWLEQHAPLPREVWRRGLFEFAQKRWRGARPPENRGAVPPNWRPAGPQAPGAPGAPGAPAPDGPKKPAR